LSAHFDAGIILLMNPRTTRSVWQYFLLTFALSLPFWLLGAFVSRQLLPGLPFSALGVVSPAAAAAILSIRENGGRGVRDLLKRSFDLGRVESKAWYLPTILLMPVVSLAAYAVLRVTGTSIPAPQITAARTLGLFLAFLVAAVCEELGWAGYAIDPLQERFGALRASLIVGVAWAAWHLVGLAEAHRPLEFVAWWTLGTISMRVVIVWLYNNTGRSVFVAALVHAVSNLTWQLFPINGSFYDPRVTGLILALAAGLVTIVWGPKTLTRKSA
jgi:membrane protease YdiL (CAAX protease family)